MQSKPKTNSIITSAYDAERNVLTFTVLGEGNLELDLSKVHASNLAHAAVHGFNQRIPDAAAIGTLDADGNVIPKGDRNRLKYERMAELIAHYESGTEEWSRVGSGGGGGKSLTIEAIARAKGWEYDRACASVTAHAEAMFAGDRKKALANLRETSAKVQTAMAEIRAESAAAKAALSAGAADDALNNMQ